MKAPNPVPPSALLQHKENFKEMDAAESQRLVRGQKDRLDYEVRKFRRRRLVKYHDLEQDLLREELNKRQNQLESAHSMLLRHHEMTQVKSSSCSFFFLLLLLWLLLFLLLLQPLPLLTSLSQELETKQQRSVHGIREGQLTTQHRTELGNQVSQLWTEEKSATEYLGLESRTWTWTCREHMWSLC